MKILSLECSAKTASCAITEGEKIIASAFTNAALTHSQTLMPMINGMLSSSKTDVKDIGAFAITSGPGSFTGIRIGISALKGMALAKNIPCIAVSTLNAIAYNFIDRDAIVCAVMDARCNQVYGALFRVKNGKIKRLCEDIAENADIFKERILKSRARCPIIIAGDGAEMFYPKVMSKKNVSKAHASLVFQNAVGVALAATEKYNLGDTVSAEKLLPVYLRLPQAERELKNKKEKDNLK
ncbi:MAG: tRNA (adenosine(37)-N6)-threonylcarbamoyltransferase complex dimerization subunit type 1 TsaB [Ruminococcaceae bacterium]|nr:tRNA (adenosine(37)-N6)-threonylcarbamoyltransferase complex dimerization subunit type 1 TsaB [Oscillospiraceae bacterium]